MRFTDDRSIKKELKRSVKKLRAEREFNYAFQIFVCLFLCSDLRNK